MTPSAFEAQMEALVGSGRPVVPLPAALRALSGQGALAPRSVAITFDDGYRDNLDEAIPVLDRFSLPATFFVVTGPLGTDGTIERYHGCCDHDRLLSWDQVREMAARGHEIGGHGRTHRELGRLSPPELEAELAACRDDLVTRFGEAPRLFCYPRGSESPAVRRATAAAGFAGACTVRPGANGPGVDPFGLTRTEVSGEDDLATFRAKLEGGHDGWHRVLQAVAAWRGGM